MRNRLIVFLGTLLLILGLFLSVLNNNLQIVLANGGDASDPYNPPVGVLPTNNNTNIITNSQDNSLSDTWKN